jgi:hypothetical protein
MSRSEKERVISSVLFHQMRKSKVKRIERKMEDLWIRMEIR